MSSAQQYARHTSSREMFAEPSVVPDESLATNLNQSIETALRARHVELGLQHRDLDSAIAVLAEAAVPDDLLLSRLKKRRLHLKDEIARIEAYF
jgi:hypothetical protein